jgi:hypothetical protein
MEAKAFTQACRVCDMSIGGKIAALPWGSSLEYGGGGRNANPPDQRVYLTTCTTTAKWTGCFAKCPNRPRPANSQTPNPRWEDWKHGVERAVGLGWT